MVMGGSFVKDSAIGCSQAIIEANIMFVNHVRLIDVSFYLCWWKFLNQGSPVWRLILEEGNGDDDMSLHGCR